MKGGGVHLRSTSKKRECPGGGPTLVPMLKSLQRGPKEGGGVVRTLKIQCQMALMKDGLWNIVSGVEEELPQADRPSDKHVKFVARRHWQPWYGQ